MIHPTMNKFTRTLFAPVIKTAEWVGIHNPVLLVKIRYFLRFKKKLNLDAPCDLNEKILYAKLFTDTSMWAELFDKYRVRGYVCKCGCSDTLTQLYGSWESVEDIDFDKLPEAFIFKASNGDGKSQYLVIRNKTEQLNKSRDVILETLRYWLSRKNVGSLSGEPYLRFVTPRILAEELLPFEENRSSLIDYKIWCINGKVEYIWTCSDRDENGTDVMTYDKNWVAHPEYSVFTSRYRRGELLPKPKNLAGLIEVAEKLAQPFPCVRVDLYHIDGKIYFGEMTFTSLGGMMDFYTQEFLDLLGKKIDINSFPKKK